MAHKLEVNNLRISFRTVNGKVQAVRDISFHLDQGETLAIVGESGSGKSVTSKAILGIQAANAITESGEIIYEGMDLLKISEEEFHKIRGDKISMIFQDPMSSLNPIVRIGKQLTEAMVLKGKARQRESRTNFNSYLKLLENAMVASSDAADAAKIRKMCGDFDKFEFKHIELEKAYSEAHENAADALGAINILTFEMEKNAHNDSTYRAGEIVSRSKGSKHEYVVSDKYPRLSELAGKLNGQWRRARRSRDYSEILPTLYEMRDILSEALAKPTPDFFRMGYYVTFSGQPLPDMPVPEMNEYLLNYLNDNFMKEFIRYAERAVEHSADESYAKMSEAIGVLNAGLPVFAEEKLDRKACREELKKLSAAVMATVDKLNIHKDSLTYTFNSSMKSEIDTYFDSIGKNAKEVRAHDRAQKKYDKAVARGKTPDYEVADAAVIDLELVKGNISHLIVRLVQHYEQLLAERGTRDYEAETVAAIDYLKTNASGVVEKVTKSVAKRRAIKLMEEVGIAEPQRRYKQYPFEFSGGMRQRIVIAIALAANPDILICDEPTTALDVTIQSQILELINRLKAERKLSVIFITHDLGVVANMADHVAVMYAGKIVEYGTSEDVFYHAAHPYTWALLSSMPDLDTNEKLEAIPGTPPNMIYPPKGDAFAARNKYAMQIDFERQPPMFKISDTHYAATWLLHPDAPKVDPPKAVRDRIERMRKKREENANASAE